MSGSDLILVPMQDIFGWAERINVPAVVSDENWSWRLPWPVDDMQLDAETKDRGEYLERLCRKAARR